jgi:hypothetical protein
MINALAIIFVAYFFIVGLIKIFGALKNGKT